MAAQGIERIVINVIRQGCGINVASRSEVRLILLHGFDIAFEEGHPGPVITHEGKEFRIGPQGRERNVTKHIGGEGFLYEVVTGNA